MVTTNDAKAINGDFRQYLHAELSQVTPQARRAEQLVYGRVLDQVMRLVAVDLPLLRWTAKVNSGAGFEIEGTVDHTEHDIATRYQVLRLWTYRYGCGHAEIRYREAIVVRARLNIRGARCVVNAQVWGPEDVEPRPGLREVRQLASPRPPIPPVSELITRYRQSRLPFADFMRAELRELAAEIEDRREELTIEEKRGWDEFFAAHPIVCSR